MTHAIRSALQWFAREAGLRFLFRRRAACAVAVLTMALALGANTAVFSVLNAFLLSGIAVPEPDRLMAVTPVRELPGRGNVIFSEAYPNYALLRRVQHSFSDVTCLLQGTASWDDNGESRPLQVARVTASFFPTMRVFPALGAAFTQKDEGPSPTAVVVISHAVWTSRLNADPKVIGSVMRIDGATYTVVGVMPEAFAQPVPTDIWLPFDIPVAWRGQVAGARQLLMFGRLADGQTFASANAAMVDFTKRAIEANSVDNKDFHYQIQTLRQSLLSGADSTIVLVQVGAAVLLLLAVLNLAALLVAWGFDRRQEMAVRRALGADGTRIIRMLFMQSVVVVAMGAVLGLVATRLALPWMRQLDLGPGLAFFVSHIALDARVLALGAIVAMVAGICAGLLPAWFTGRGDFIEALRSGSRSATLSRAALRWQQLMVFTQAAMSVVVMTAATLLAVSFRNLQRVPAGFTAPSAVVARVQLQDQTYSTHEKRAAFASALLDNLSREPAIAAYGFTSTLPVGDALWGGRFFLENPDGSVATETTLLHFRRVSPSYLTTIGIPLAAGRQIDDHDVAASVAVCVISQTLASRLWPGQSAIGKHIYRPVPTSPTPVPIEIVGVAGAVMDAGFAVPSGETVYVPYAQNSVVRMSIVVRPRTDDAAALEGLRHALRATDPVIAAAAISTVDALVRQATSLQRLQSVLLVVFALVALLIVALGSYGVMTQLVASREKEYALRLVFGAVPSNLGRAVFTQMARVTLPGVVAGTVATLLLGGLLRPFVFGIDPSSAGVQMFVAGMMLAVVSVATLPSALRAMRLDVRSGV